MILENPPCAPPTPPPKERNFSQKRKKKIQKFPNFLVKKIIVPN